MNKTATKERVTAQGLQEALRAGSWTSALGPLGLIAFILVAMALIAIFSR